MFSGSSWSQTTSVAAEYRSKVPVICWTGQG